MILQYKPLRNNMVAVALVCVCVWCSTCSRRMANIWMKVRCVLAYMCLKIYFSDGICWPGRICSIYIYINIRMLFNVFIFRYMLSAFYSCNAFCPKNSYNTRSRFSFFVVYLFLWAAYIYVYIYTYIR